MEQEKTNLENVVEKEVEVTEDEFFADDESQEDDNDLFDDEDVENNQDESDESDEVVEDNKTNVIKIKFNGAEESLDMETQYDEIVALIQKGKNYDHVKQEQESLQPTISELQQIAKDVGAKDVNGLLAKLKQDIHSEKVNSRVQELIQDGMSEKHAKQLAELELKQNVEPLQQDAKEDESTQEDVGKQLFVELFEEYPELVKLEYKDFPQEVKEMIENGKKPLVAYQKYLLDKERQEKEQLAHKAKIKDRNVGSLKTAKDDNADDFLSEFDM